MLALLLVLAAPDVIHNARLETRTVTRPLAAEVAAVAGSEPTWVGWSVPMHGTARACCFNFSKRGKLEGGCCALESKNDLAIGNDNRGMTDPHRVHVLMRVESGTVTRLRAYTEDCDVDADGRRFVWLEGVAPADSVAYLDGLLGPHGKLARGRGEDVLSALALHEAPEAVRSLLAHAKSDPDSEMRSQALFWLAQHAGAEARAAITRAIEEDPETEVKRQAVFALSEMPPDEGVPMLIDLARRHKNPAVREQAFFWLGESEDPRALKFFEEVLR
jgi:hypothetical protein